MELDLFKCNFTVSPSSSSLALFLISFLTLQQFQMQMVKQYGQNFYEGYNIVNKFVSAPFRFSLANVETSDLRSDGRGRNRGEVDAPVSGNGQLQGLREHLHELRHLSELRWRPDAAMICVC